VSEASTVEYHWYGVMNLLLNRFIGIKEEILNPFIRDKLGGDPMEFCVVEPQTRRPYEPSIQAIAPGGTDRRKTRVADFIEVGYPANLPINPGMLDPGTGMAQPSPRAPLTLKVVENKRADAFIARSLFQLEDVCYKALEPFRRSDQNSCFAILQIADRLAFFEYYKILAFNRAKPGPQTVNWEL